MFRELVVVGLCVFETDSSLRLITFFIRLALQFWFDFAILSILYLLLLLLNLLWFAWDVMAVVLWWGDACVGWFRTPRVHPIPLRRGSLSNLDLLVYRCSGFLDCYFLYSTLSLIFWVLLDIIEFQIWRLSRDRCIIYVTLITDSVLYHNLLSLNSNLSLLSLAILNYIFRCCLWILMCLIQLRVLYGWHGRETLFLSF